MRTKTNRALLGAALTLALAPVAASAATTVSVRIEGAKKTLLPATSRSAAVRPGDEVRRRLPGRTARPAHSTPRRITSGSGSFSKSFSDFSVTGDPR